MLAAVCNQKILEAPLVDRIAFCERELSKTLELMTKDFAVEE